MQNCFSPEDPPSSYSSLCPCLGPSLRATTSPRPPKSVKGDAQEPKGKAQTLARKFAHQLIVLPYYSVFDLHRVSRSTQTKGHSQPVTSLRPHALRPMRKQPVKSLEGVSSGQKTSLKSFPSPPPTRNFPPSCIPRDLFEDSTLQRYARFPESTRYPRSSLRNGGSYFSIGPRVLTEAEKKNPCLHARPRASQGFPSVKNNPHHSAPKGAPRQPSQPFEKLSQK